MTNIWKSYVCIKYNNIAWKDSGNSHKLNIVNKNSMLQTRNYLRYYLNVLEAVCGFQTVTLIVRIEKTTSDNTPSPKAPFGQLHFGLFGVVSGMEPFRRYVIYSICSAGPSPASFSFFRLFPLSHNTIQPAETSRLVHQPNGLIEGSVRLGIVMDQPNEA